MCRKTLLTYYANPKGERNGQGAILMAKRTDWKDGQYGRTIFAKARGWWRDGGWATEVTFARAKFASIVGHERHSNTRHGCSWTKFRPGLYRCACQWRGGEHLFLTYATLSALKNSSVMAFRPGCYDADTDFLNDYRLCMRRMTRWMKPSQKDGAGRLRFCMYEVAIANLS